jgi:hypothetical protein
MFSDVETLGTCSKPTPVQDPDHVPLTGLTTASAAGNAFNSYAWY